MKSIKRREFIRMAALSTAAAAMASCAPKATEAPAAAPTDAPAVEPTEASAAAATDVAPTAAPVVEPTMEGNLMTMKASGQEIEVWGWDKPEFNKVVEDYIKQSAGVTVKGQTMGGDDLWKKITTSSAAGIGLPDAFKSTSTNTPQLVEMGAVMDITDLANTVKDLLPEVAWTMLSYQGKVYGVAANSPAAGFFWRYDVCEQYGIDPATIKTWDQFIEAGMKVKKDSGDKNFLMYTPAVGIGFLFTVLQQEHHASLLTQDMQVAIGPEKQEWLDTLALAKKLRDAGISTAVDEWTEPWYQAIKDGSLACYPIGTWFVETIKQQAPDSTGKWYFTPFATVKEGDDPYTNSGSASCYISSQTSKVDAAWEWVKAWTLDPYGSLELGLKELGISVISKAALTNEFVTAPHPLFAKSQAYWLDATEAFTNSTYVPPVTKLDGEATTIFNTEIEKWWNGDVTTEEFLTTVADQLHSTLKI